MFRCPYCGGVAGVPATAAPTEDEPNLRRYVPPPKQYFEDVLPEPKEPKQPQGPTPWGIWDIIKYIAIYVLGGVVIAGLLEAIYYRTLLIIYPPGGALFHIENSPYHVHFWNLISVINDIFAIWLIYYYVSVKHRNSFREALSLRPVAKKDIRRYGLIAFYIIIAITLISIIVYFTPLRDLIPDNLPIDDQFRRGLANIIWFSILAPLAAVPEELTFRGFIFAGLRNRLGVKWAAIVTTLAFVAFHGPQLAFSPFHLAIISIGAIVFMIVRIKTDSLSKAMLVHFFYNLILSVIIWIGIAFVGIDRFSAPDSEEHTAVASPTTWKPQAHRMEPLRPDSPNPARR